LARVVSKTISSGIEMQAASIAGTAIDVFDQEPLPVDHPLRALPNLLATPHIGYVSRDLYARFYQDTVANICRWLDGQRFG
jgi:phosphoglycerate dehydrogenase-like enzyme